ncbi:DUF6286 domain-containing protein [Actinokineospora iranica]|uniref:DUF6286 domain-containing protein n=1 Tax=Actinokineospora iranica TaxID=1271860 RepID=A0A1G6LK17_9PSEU|nr:DUF6286 domain-containing protein [Actinokineospora iranica]SDC43514.1 hypothetical protein SAMN05216174_102112 [Actinokineospora iranica]
MRVLVRILTLLLGLALAGVGALLAVEVAWTWARPVQGPLLVPWPQWRDRLAELTWQSGSVRLVAAAVAVAGLLLLLFAATARRKDVALLDPGPGITVRTSPRSLARIVGARVRAEENVAAASVTATPKRVRVRAVSGLETEAHLRPRLLDVVAATLADLPLTRKPKVSVVVDSPKDRS